MHLDVLEPSGTTIMIKPVGALCNLDCTYCYYLPTKVVYEGREHRMGVGTLEDVFAGVLPHFGPEVTICWQGGEPTLAGLDFFQKAIEFQSRYRRAGQVIKHALQTNGTLLDDDWCRFLHRHQFLVGLSIDGSAKFHDRYRLTNHREGSSDMVMAGLNCLQKHQVEYNLLCVLNDVNVHHPDELMQYLISLGANWLQFIPAIEWVADADAPADRPQQNVLAPYSPSPAAYGKFLCRAFDLWFDRYRDRISVRIFDAVLMKMVMDTMPFCILDGSCHNQLTVEHDGSVFLCDHFIERRWQVAHVGDAGWLNAISADGGEAIGLTVHGRGYEKSETHVGRDIDGVDDLPVMDNDDAHDASDLGWYQRVDRTRLATFASRKQHLPQQCISCKWKPYCHGGCPKHRPSGGEVPEPTILCEAYMMFYEHATPRLQWLAQFLKRNESPPPPARRRRGKSKVKSRKS